MTTVHLASSCCLSYALTLPACALTSHRGYGTLNPGIPSTLDCDHLSFDPLGTLLLYLFDGCGNGNSSQGEHSCEAKWHWKCAWSRPVACHPPLSTTNIAWWLWSCSSIWIRYYRIKTIFLIFLSRSAESFFFVFWISVKKRYKSNIPNI